MQLEFLELNQTGQYPRLVRDYLKQVEDMRSFTEQPPSLDGLKETLKYRKAQKKDCKVLAQVLDRQMANPSVKQSQNIEALRADVAYTVCTGHQLCLMGGPVYMVYKICSIIRLAEDLSQSSGEKIVPLFWMATEDHDSAEVDHFHLFGRRFSLKHSHQGAVRDLSLPQISLLMEELKPVLGESENAERIFKILEELYREDYSMEKAFRGLINRLFSEHGLLILDASDPKLKRAFIPQMKRELIGSELFHAMKEKEEMMRNRGEKVQAMAREINLFYMPKGFRTRIVREGERWKTLEGGFHWTQAELEKHLEDCPELFSPNVLFRPVYQESILPNVAYVGGPGELSYWLQLRDVFHVFQKRMPVLLLRDTFLRVDERTEKKWAVLGYTWLDLFKEDVILHRDYVNRHSQEEIDIAHEKQGVLKSFDKLVERSGKIDPGLVAVASAERKRLMKAIEGIEKKVMRTGKRKNAEALERITSIRQRFLPKGKLREREENFLHWYLRYGDEFIEQVIHASNPLDARLKILKV